MDTRHVHPPLLRTFRPAQPQDFSNVATRRPLRRERADTCRILGMNIEDVAIAGPDGRPLALRIYRRAVAMPTRRCCTYTRTDADSWSKV